MDFDISQEFVEFSKISFSLFSSEEVKKISVVEIKESKLSGENTVYDPRLGVIVNHSQCVTCGKNNQDCPGHCGHIELPIPVPHPMYGEEILMYLNCFCSKCSSLFISKDIIKLKNIHKLKGSSRIKTIKEFCEKVSSCNECGENKYTYYINENKYYGYLKSKSDRFSVTYTEIEEILGNIKDSDVNSLGLDPSIVHPINLILTNLIVLPICARPFVDTSKGLCDDDLTSKYIDIVKLSNKIKTKTMKESEKKEAIENLEFHIRTLMFNHKQKARQINGRPIKCIRERMNGKDGLFRNNLSGKRGDFSARTVIGPDPRLRADEIAIPEEFSKKLTFPEIVNSINIKILEELVNNDGANFVKRDGKTYDLKYNLRTRNTYEKDGFALQSGDFVLRDGKKIDPIKFKKAVGSDISIRDGDKIVRDGKILKNIKPSERIPFEVEYTDTIERDGRVISPEKIKNSKGFFELVQGDRVYRKGVELKNIIVSQKREFKLVNGDVVERHLKNGDYVLFGRQPTLHKGSLLGRKIKIIKNTSGINSHRSIRTIRMNLAQNKTYNADFDGDEMNILVPQSYEAVAELKWLSSTGALLKSSQSSRLLLCITQDALTAGYILTCGEKKGSLFKKYVSIDKDTWNDAVSTIDYWSIDYIIQKMAHIKNVLEWKGFSEYEREEFLYSGHGLVSMLLPDDFEYSYEASSIDIVRGVMISGVLGKQSLGDGHSSICHKLEKDYGSEVTIDFISYYQFVVNHCIKCRGFSIGLEDCLSAKVKDVKDEITKSFMEASIIEQSETDLSLRERKINNVLNNATSVGQKISKDELQFDNSLNIMVLAGSKGSYVNIAQIRSLLGQQNVEGKRMPLNFGGRTLPHYNKGYFKLPEDATIEDEEEERRLVYESRGFVTHSFIEGLSPQELFFHAEGGREGVIDTAIKSVTGDTTIIFIENGNTKHVQIGEWIDNLMKMNNDKIIKQDEQNMEIYKLEKNTLIPTTDEKGNVTWEEITHVTRHDPSKFIYKVKTYSGRSVVVAESKSLLVWNKEIEELEQVYTPDIKVGDFLPVTMNLSDFKIVKSTVDMNNYFSKEQYLYGSDFHIAVKEMNDSMNIPVGNKGRMKIYKGWWSKNNRTKFTLPYNSKAKLQRAIYRSDISNIENGYIYSFSSSRKNKINSTFELDTDNGIFIGLYLAEGSNDKYRVSITNNNLRVRTFVKDWFKKHYIHCDEYSYKNNIGGITTTVRGYSVLLVKFLDKFVGKGAENKFIPNEAFTAPTEFITGILNGYYSGDGCIAKNDIVVASASQRLIEGVSFLCSMLGIFGKFSKSVVNSNNLNTKNIKPSYRFSIRSRWAKIFSQKISFIDDNKNRLLKCITPTKIHNCFNSYNDIVLDKIISIEKIISNPCEKLYDLTIPSTLNFGLANGLQVADTAQSGYIQRKLVKKMEDLVKTYSFGMVVNSRNMVVQFNYENNFDPARLVRTGPKMSFINISSVCKSLNTDYEWREWLSKKVSLSNGIKITNNKKLIKTEVKENVKLEIEGVVKHDVKENVKVKKIKKVQKKIVFDFEE